MGRFMVLLILLNKAQAELLNKQVPGEEGEGVLLTLVLHPALHGAIGHVQHGEPDKFFL